MRFSSLLKPNLTALTKLTVVGLAACAVAIWIQWLSGLLFVLSGPLQFSRTLRQRHLRWRRWSGRICLLFGLVIGVSALVMSFWMPSIGGLNQATASTLFALFFLFALGKAFRHIRRREIALHRGWMIRAFSIGIAIATIRPIIVLLFLISRPSGLTPYEFFGAGFWLGFVLHLMAAEAWIHWTQSQLRINSKKSDLHQKLG